MKNGSNNLVVHPHLDILLRDVGDLRGGPVPRVDEDGVVGLTLPLRVASVHRLQPIFWSPKKKGIRISFQKSESMN